MLREREHGSLPGLPAAVVLFVVLCGLVYTLIATAGTLSVPATIALVVAVLFDLFLMGGLFVVNPNEGRVLQLFGDYVGTSKKARRR